MISDARGGHVSPGVYTEEKDVTYSVKSLGITSLGLVGETVKGPAFQNVPIKDWSEYVDYFGGTSPEKFKGTGLPKYELPYIAESYLRESKNLNVVRVLGLSGYKTSPAFVVYAEIDKKKYPLVVLRSKGDYSGETGEGNCDKAKQEMFKPFVTSATVTNYVSSEFDAQCVVNGTKVEIPLSGTVKKDGGSNYKILVDENGREIGKFGLLVKTTTDTEGTTYYVSLNPRDRDYIYNVLSTDPLSGSAPLFIEAVYDYAFNDLIQNAVAEDKEENISGATITLVGGPASGVTKEEGSTSAVTFDYTNFNEMYRCAQTPWIVSEIKAAASKSVEMKKLFKVFTISDGNAANYQVKISICRIRPDEGLFDLWVRDFYDTDESPVVLEKFSNLSMREGDASYIGLKIGTFDGGYVAKSKYITVMINDEDGVESCTPCGFLGYPMLKYEGEKIPMAYNTMYNDEVKPKRQFFGLNSNILDEDVLNYKGVDAYTDYDATPEKLTNGFHMDAIVSMAKGGANEATSGNNLNEAVILVDGVSGFTFTTVDANQNAASSVKIPRLFNEAFTEGTIYEDMNLRKFTVYPYGGFDGWDIYRNFRTNTDKYKATRYPIVDGCPFAKIGNEIDLDPTLNLNLPANAISSDYYAYLAGYRQFANPNDVDINLFATPGVDFYHNTLLIEDALDVIEDPDDGRGGDALHIITAPQTDYEVSNGLASFSGKEFTADEIGDLLDESEIKSSYACTYWPWVKYYDGNAKMYLNLPVTKDVVRNMAETDNNSYPWFAPAGVARGNVDCVKAYVKTTLSDEDDLYNGRINPIKTFAVDGVKVWGNKTLYPVESPLNRINVRRLMLRVKKLVVSAAKNLLFEQLDNALDQQFKSLVEPILANVKSNRGISDYRVITEMTPESRDAHTLPCRIAVKPVSSLEYVSISFIVTPESVDFEE